MRARPAGEPVMHQTWEDLLFLHWPISPTLLRPLIPDRFGIDTFDGVAWIGITPFHLEDVRPPMLPALPWLSSFDEINVRTYVTYNNKPGIWFFSLDASAILPVIGARLLFMLPYFKASTRFDRLESAFQFTMKRMGVSAAEFKAKWITTGIRLRDPAVDSLAFFLVERYSAFASEGSSLFETRVYHHPWILEEAAAEIKTNTLITSLGLPAPQEPPITYFGKSLEVEIWPPQRLL
jgi:uncharacterized protein YqjF (DUF2071 family)